MINNFFNENKWLEAIKSPDWYLNLIDDYNRILKNVKDTKESEELKEEVYKFFEDHLIKGDIKLGKNGRNQDEERKEIDTVIIHHTSIEPGITWQRLSAIHLVRLYASYYASPYYDKDKHIKGEPIYSHHFRNGIQVFYAYHWLVRMDGSVERLLNDNEIGWHAGNWDINCRSVAICLDNDYENSSPSDLVLNSVSKLIKEHYPQIKHNNIFGHREINPKTNCPGNNFLNDWKNKLLPVDTNLL